MKVLIIDNTIDRDSWGVPEIVAHAREALAGTGATIVVRRSPQEDLPGEAEDFDRIIVSGSKTTVAEEAPWIGKLDALVRGVAERGQPLLGICYGHQVLARALGGKRTVRRAPRGEFGWARVTQSAESKLLDGLPREFHAFEWHQDEVVELPRGLRALARSELCALQACELEGKPVYGVQFHPERGLEAGERSLDRRAKSDPRAECLGRGQGARLFDAAVGRKIFANFLQGVRS